MIQCSKNFKALKSLVSAHPKKLSFCLGALSSLAMAPTHIFVILWVSFPALILLIDQVKTKKQAFVIAWLFGFGFFVSGLYWISFALLVDFASYGWAMPFAIVGLPFILAIFYGLAGLFYNYANPQTPLSKALIFACCLSLFELIRGFIFTGFPWNIQGYAFGFAPEMQQLAAYIGIYGLTFLAILLPALFISKRGALISLILLLAMAGFGMWRTTILQTEFYNDISFSLIQPNIAQKDKWDKDLNQAHFEKLLSLSREAMAKTPETNKHYLIWPETALTFFPSQNPDKVQAIHRLLQNSNTSLITGGIDFDKSESGTKIYNTVFAIPPLVDARQDTNHWQRYEKSHLVPFGEYIPFQDYIPLMPVTSTGFTPGPYKRSLEIKDGSGLRFSPLICYEAIFSGRVATCKNRPDFLLNVTNDAWYQNSIGPYQHHDIVKLRAIEEGIPFFRVANTGISSLTTALGDTISLAPYGKTQIIISNLPKKLQNATLYACYSKVLFLALSVFFIGIPLAYARLTRNNKNLA